MDVKLSMHVRFVYRLIVDSRQSNKHHRAISRYMKVLQFTVQPAPRNPQLFFLVFLFLQPCLIVLIFLVLPSIGPHRGPNEAVIDVDIC